MHLSHGLLHQILEYYSEFAVDLAINIKNWVDIDDIIAVGASYLTLVAMQKATQEYCVKFSDTVRPGKL